MGNDPITKAAASENSLHTTELRANTPGYDIIEEFFPWFLDDERVGEETGNTDLREKTLLLLGQPQWVIQDEIGYLMEVIRTMQPMGLEGFGTSDSDIVSSLCERTIAHIDEVYNPSDPEFDVWVRLRITFADEEERVSRDLKKVLKGSLRIGLILALIDSWYFGNCIWGDDMEQALSPYLSSSEDGNFDYDPSKLDFSSDEPDKSRLEELFLRIGIMRASGKVHPQFPYDRSLIGVFPGYFQSEALAKPRTITSVYDLSCLMRYDLEIISAVLADEDLPNWEDLLDASGMSEEDFEEALGVYEERKRLMGLGYEVTQGAVPLSALVSNLYRRKADGSRIFDERAILLCIAACISSSVSRVDMIKSKADPESGPEGSQPISPQASRNLALIGLMQNRFGSEYVFPFEFEDLPEYDRLDPVIQAANPDDLLAEIWDLFEQFSEFELYAQYVERVAAVEDEAIQSLAESRRGVEANLYQLDLNIEFRELAATMVKHELICCLEDTPNDSERIDRLLRVFAHLVVNYTHFPNRFLSEHPTLDERLSEMYDVFWGGVDGSAVEKFLRENHDRYPNLQYSDDGVGGDFFREFDQASLEDLKSFIADLVDEFTE